MQRTSSWHLAVVLAVAWTVAVALSLGWNIHLMYGHVVKQAYGMANAAIDKDMAYRQLVAGAGGIYVPVEGGVEPNPYLSHVPHRDIETPDGRRLTLVNSSYFTRLVHDIEAEGGGLRGTVTSLQPLRPANSPDSWHRDAMLAFHAGADEVSEVVRVNNQAQFRLMRPRHAQESCFACHPRGEIGPGDVLGGLSVAVPLQPLRERLFGQLATLAGGHAGLWLIGLFGIRIGHRRIARQEQFLAYNAHHDSLTGLPNRNYLVGYLPLQMEEASSRDHHLALMLFDLDRFKNVNDSLGHSVGDALLQEIARRLNRQARDGDRVCRLGGDEFIVVLNRLGPDSEQAFMRARSIAERFHEQLGQPYQVLGYELHVTPSIGIAVFPEQGDTLEDLLRHADVAMYKAKSEGRNNIAFFMPGMQAAVDQRLRLEKEMRAGLARGEFHLHYQPQYDTRERIVGFEALARWESPQLGSVSPMEFIPVAEESGLILALGEQLMAAAVKQARAWVDEGLFPDEGTLSVNVSAHQFHRQEFVNHIRSTLEQAGLPARCLDIELTESIVIDDVQGTIKKMEALRQYGVSFSIDDFGTGYSSLSYLKLLPVHNLKIDRSFVRDIDSDSNDAVIVETIIGMATHLGLEVIAEGVENLAHLDFLKAHGCHRYQGYYFSRPLPADEVTQLLRKQQADASSQSAV